MPESLVRALLPCLHKPRLQTLDLARELHELRAKVGKLSPQARGLGTVVVPLSAQSANLGVAKRQCAFDCRAFLNPRFEVVEQALRFAAHGKPRRGPCTRADRRDQRKALFVGLAGHARRTRALCSAIS